MVKSHWKRFSFYERGLTFFFMINIFLDVINDKLLDSVIPGEIVGYLFWLSLGLYLGFRLCKYEYGNVIKDSQNKKLF